MITGESTYSFKFHYVSINSQDGKHTYYDLYGFKFHYVSINSVYPGSRKYSYEL